MTYTGGWFFRWRILGLFCLAGVVVFTVLDSKHLLYSKGLADDSAGVVFSWWFARCAWVSMLLINVFRSYQKGFYFITKDNGDLIIKNVLWPLPVREIERQYITRVDFKKTGMFYYKLQVNCGHKKTRWYGNNALNVQQWQALVDDLKAHGIAVEVNNLATD